MSIHDTIEHAREHVGCICGAMAGKPCTCDPGVHLARIARDHFTMPGITGADFSAVIAHVCTGTTIVTDGEEAAAWMAQTWHVTLPPVLTEVAAA